MATKEMHFKIHYHLNNGGLYERCQGDSNPGCGGCSSVECEQACSTITTTTTSIPDTDSDGILDNVDNCPNNCNTQQLDADVDGTGDVCDSEPGCGGCNQPACEQQC